IPRVFISWTATDRSPKLVVDQLPLPRAGLYRPPVTNPVLHLGAVPGFERGLAGRRAGAGHPERPEGAGLHREGLLGFHPAGLGPGLGARRLDLLARELHLAFGADRQGPWVGCRAGGSGPEPPPPFSRGGRRDRTSARRILAGYRIASRSRHDRRPFLRGRWT